MTDTISLNDLDMDFSAPSTELPEQGFYLFRIEKVRDAKVEANIFYKPENARRPEDGREPEAGEYPVRPGDPYIDKTSGYWVNAKRTWVLIECRPLADSREDFANLGSIYVYYDLTPKNGGGHRPGKQLRLLIDACFGATMAGVNAMASLIELEGATFWGNLTHQKPKDGTKTYGKIANPTDQAPSRYLSRTTGDAMDRVVNSARYDEPDPIPDDEYYAAQGEDINAENPALPDDPRPESHAALTPIEFAVIGEIDKAEDDDYLEFLTKRARRSQTLTPAVQNAIDRRARHFALTS